MSIVRQNVTINIIDADTREIIRKDFSVYIYPGGNGDYFMIRDGSDTVSTGTPIQLILLDDAQILSYGYDPKSFLEDRSFNVTDTVYEGDDSKGIIRSVYYFCPWVITIRLKKLAE